MNLFDGLQVAAHNVVSNTMGYATTWTPSAGGPMQSAIVLFRDPTQKDQIADEEFTDIGPRIEFLEGDFIGLAEAVSANRTETIIVNGVSYLGYKAERRYDGKSVIIHLEEAT